MRELTAIIRNQIPAGRKSILDAYGEIAFQAWRHTFGGCRYEVEHTLLQVGCCFATASAQPSCYTLQDDLYVDAQVDELHSLTCARRFGDFAM